MSSRRPLITVNTLTTQLRERGAVELPADALITPAAQDWLRGTRVRVHRVGAATGAGGCDGNGAVSAPPRVYVVGDAAVPVMQALLPGLERQIPGLRFLPCHGHMAGLMAALHETCTALGGCTRRRGVVIVRNGADVCCVANKYPRVRAAILAAPSALLSLQTELGANLLILERDRMSLQQMRAAIERFVAGPAHVSPVIAEALAVAREGEAPAESLAREGETAGSTAAEARRFAPGSDRVATAVSAVRTPGGC